MFYTKCMEPTEARAVPAWQNCAFNTGFIPVKPWWKSGTSLLNGGFFICL